MEIKPRIHPRFDEPPFLHERTACGINSLIDILDLPVSKLTEVSPSLLLKKMIEISGIPKSLISAEGLSCELHSLIERLCENQNTKDVVIEISFHKFLFLLKHNKLN